MFNKMILTMFAMALLSPSKVDAYGAAHVGYTHVGPNGVQHVGESAYRGPNTSGATTHTTAYGASGGAYHSTTTTHAGYGGAAVGGSSYHFSGGSAAGGSYHYAYVR
ncbi:MAG: hypothetical protein K8T89_24635 [Planctomycetes bacterium]|nr:hypothetical protein [Planctomycetota bacterium]